MIRDDAEALRTAAGLAEEFRPGASGRDARRELPRAELDRLTATGLLAVTVPAEHGGADVSAATLAELFRLLASADASLAQIPQSHFAYVNVLRQQGSPEQQAFFFAEVLAGRRFGNAQSEAGTKHLQDIRTRLITAEDGSYLLTGVKNYSTGALFADWIPVLARAEDDLLHVAYVPADALLAAAARAVDAARADLDDDSAAEASIAVAAAKAYAGSAALEIADALFEVPGTRAALDSLNLHRHWRDARTHTLHDPARWKIQHIGRYVLNGTRPPRHGLL
ncbi:acyl-CoA dehydrogenase family protein [Streptomyces arboris]|uniref:acyl-CoA dehydrogenase family protein n=1 Tax=Streptomyces arboris TaxID=2600619 RepID=UPI003C2D1F81